MNRGSGSDLPHLTLQKIESLDNRVGRIPHRDLVRATRIVGRAVDEIIPDLAITIEGAISMPIPMEVVAPELPGSGLVLIAHRQRVVEPVVDICVPLPARQSTSTNKGV